MTLLHTSDWHLGRTLYSKKDRQEEQAAFLQWLLSAIETYSVDLLIVAGDVFDNASPSSNAQKMYYDFLIKVRNSGCQNVIVIGGNHDSPSFLNAPKDILAALNVCVIGNAGENIEDEIVTIKDGDENPLAIVCAVPFLRERDISRFTEGENYGDRAKRIAENIKTHYQKIAEFADNKRNSTDEKIPVIATGHLSVAGGKTVDDDGVRETYIGAIECVGSEIFSPIFDYVALGHYHIPSVISQTVRYSGAPLPMGFGEAAQKKSVNIVEFCGKNTKISTIEIPVFQKLETIRGDKTQICNRLEELIWSGNSVWLEIIYDGADVFPDLTAWANSIVADTKIEIIKIQNRQYLNEVLTRNDSTQLLDELDKFEVFDKLLEKNDIATEQQNELKNLYREINAELLIVNY